MRLKGPRAFRLPVNSASSRLITLGLCTLLFAWQVLTAAAACARSYLRRPEVYVHPSGTCAGRDNDQAPLPGQTGARAGAAGAAAAAAGATQGAPAAGGEEEESDVDEGRAGEQGRAKI